MGKKSKNKKSWEEFHKEHLSKLIECGKSYCSMTSFPPVEDGAYTREDAKGWWMATKEMIINSYIYLYLYVWKAPKNMDTKLFFIDALSSWGMNRITKSQGRDSLHFLGTALNAHCNCQNPIFKNKFQKIFANDFEPDKREVLRERFQIANNNSNYPINFQIPDRMQGRVDSNQWLLEVMARINQVDGKKNYLMVIDNQGMDIYFDTIKQIREMNKYGDLIITYQEQTNARVRATEDAKNFIGKKFEDDLPREKMRELYIQQLNELGFGRIEPFIVKGKGFYYVLLFCCRKESSDWLDMIEKYREERYCNWSDKNVKEFWDILENKQSQLTQFGNAPK